MGKKRGESSENAGKSIELHTTTTPPPPPQQQSTDNKDIVLSSAKAPSGSQEQDILHGKEHVVDEEKSYHESVVNKEEDVDTAVEAPAVLTGNIDTGDDSPTKPHVVHQVAAAITPADSVTEDNLILDTRRDHHHQPSDLDVDRPVTTNVDGNDFSLASSDAPVIDSQATASISDIDADNTLLQDHISSVGLADTSCEIKSNDPSDLCQIVQSIHNDSAVRSMQAGDSNLPLYMANMDTTIVHKDETSVVNSSRDVFHLSSRLVTSPSVPTSADAPVASQDYSLLESMTAPTYLSSNPNISTYSSSNPNISTRHSGNSWKLESTGSQMGINQPMQGTRKPLTDLYGEYLCDSTDTCLDDARRRLQTALAQTWMLQKAFTDRLYEKYRVCLRPARNPDEIMKRIHDDPIAAHEQLRNEMDAIREEKEVERKEAALLNAEMTASNVPASLLGGVDNAEQLMYYTAGLNLVILPEEEVPEEQSKNYPDRRPTIPATGQRIRTISQAAAVAGEVMLDRTRKALVMKADRKRRRRVQFVPNDKQADYELRKEPKIPAAVGQNELSSRISRQESKVLSNHKSLPATYPMSSMQLPPPNATHSLISTNLSTNMHHHPAAFVTAATLTSLHANHDELMNVNSKPRASTSWLQRHSARALDNTNSIPYPVTQDLSQERRYGRRQEKRSADKISSNLPHGLKTTSQRKEHELPPLPTVDERLSSKPLSVSSSSSMATDRMRHSLESLFDGGDNESTTSETNTFRCPSKVDLFRRMLSNDEEISKRSNPQVGGMERSHKFSIRFTFSVLHALGYFRKSTPSNTKTVIPPFGAGDGLPWTDAILALADQIEKSDCRLSNVITKRKAVHDSEPKGSDKDESSVATETMKDAKNSTDQRTSNVASVENDTEVMLPMTKRRRSASSPGQTSIPGPSFHLTNETMKVPGAATLDNISTVAPLHFHGIAYNHGAQLTNQYDRRWSVADTSLFRHQLNAPYTHHPAAGDLARFSGAFTDPSRRHEYDLFLQQSLQSQLLPMNPNQSDSLRFSLALNNSLAQSQIGRDQQTSTGHLGYPIHQPFVPSLFHHNTIGRTFPSYPQQPWMMMTRNAYPLGNQITTLKSDPSVIPSFPLSDSQMQQNASMANPNYQIEQKGYKDEKKGATIDSEERGSASSSQALSKEENIALVERTDTTERLTTNGNKLVLFFPTAPVGLPHIIADGIKLGKFHKSISLLTDYSQMVLSLEYLMAVSAAVPIPKVMVTILLKEHMMAKTFRQYGVGGSAPISREIIASVILIWLWTNYENTFQQAFAKSGRVDVDRECKMLIQASVISVTKALEKEIEASIANRMGAFAEATTTRHCTDAERVVILKRVELNTAMIVSQALAEDLPYCQQTDIILSNIHDAVGLLDATRCIAFKMRAKERSLLASFLSGKIMIDSMFADAYTSSLIRSGRAFGHGDLFELVQNENLKASAMIPYDIFTDETGSWEEPNRPETGFTTGLNGKQLIRRAHARAMFNMSLKKIQEYNNIGGGTTSYGPYEPLSQTQKVAEKRPITQPSPRAGLKRRISAILEVPIPAGTGSAVAKSVAVYEPKHVVASLEHNSSSLSNSPYGMHSVVEYRRKSVAGPVAKKMKSCSTGLPRSTREVDWADVASGFTLVKLPKKSSGSKHAPPVTTHNNASNRTIFAPFVRQISISDLLDEEDEMESDTEEDITENSYMQRHQVVLDKMRENLNKFTEERKKNQKLRRNVTK